MKHFSKQGVLRDQVAFLTALHSKGGIVDRREGSRIAFIFFSGVIDYIGVAGVRSRLSRMKANGIYLYYDSDMNYSRASASSETCGKPRRLCSSLPRNSAPIGLLPSAAPPEGLRPSNTPWRSMVMRA